MGYCGSTILYILLFPLETFGQKLQEMSLHLGGLMKLISINEIAKRSMTEASIIADRDNLYIVFIFDTRSLSHFFSARLTFMVS